MGTAANGIRCGSYVWPIGTILLWMKACAGKPKFLACPERSLFPDAKTKPAPTIAHAAIRAPPLLNFGVCRVS
jgi:hypothetical protein